MKYYPKRAMLTSIVLVGVDAGVCVSFGVDFGDGFCVGIGVCAIFTGLSVFIRFNSTDGTKDERKKKKLVQNSIFNLFH